LPISLVLLDWQLVMSFITFWHRLISDWLDLKHCITIWMYDWQGSTGAE